MKTYYQVFVSANYMRNAQIYSNAELDMDDTYVLDDENHKSGWIDIYSSILVLEGYYDSITAVGDALKKFYPKASADIFLIKSFPTVTDNHADVAYYRKTPAYKDALEIKEYRGCVVYVN